MGIAIIVITGHPFRGKTDVVEKIAKWLGCPTLFMEGILEALRPCVLSYAFTDGPLEGLQQPSSARNVVLEEEEEEEARHLAGTALRIFFCQVTYLVRSVDASNGCVVLEFPVSSPTVLEILIELLDNQSLDRGLIIECMPPTKTNFSDLLEVERPGVWYHHDTWADIEKAIKREHLLMSSKFDDDEELSPTNLVSTLKIDPATDFNFLKDPPRREEGRPVPSAFFEAVEYLIFKRDVVKEGPLFINMRQWGALRHELLRLGEKGSTGRSAPCFKGASYHDIIYTAQIQTELIDEPECSLCGELVKDSAYKCTCCLLHLHKACGELAGTTRDSLPPATHDWRTFPETHVCTSCKEQGINDFSFSKDCKSCLFITFLKCRLRPIVIHHPFLQDFLQIQVSSEADANIFDSCAACGQRLHFGIRYFYRHASLYYGFSCTALMALELEHVHFGYKHPLKLRREPYYEFDSYICHVCCRERYPHHWFYYCEECDYEAHVYCIYSSIAANYH